MKKLAFRLIHAAGEGARPEPVVTEAHDDDAVRAGVERAVERLRETSVELDDASALASGATGAIAQGLYQVSKGASRATAPRPPPSR